MKLYKYRIFNLNTQSYFGLAEFSIENIACQLDRYQLLHPQFQFEVHQIEIGRIALVIEND